MPNEQPSGRKSLGRTKAAQAAPTPTETNSAGHHPLENTQHEAFAQRVAGGEKPTGAYRTVYGVGDESAAQAGSRLFRHVKVCERIGFLMQQQAEACEMTRAELIQMLVDTIRSKPSAAGLDNPLCELRMSKAGPYAAFMDKTRAAERLCKLLGWEAPEKVEHSGKTELVVTVALPQSKLAELQERRRRAITAGSN